MKTYTDTDQFLIEQANQTLATLCAYAPARALTVINVAVPPTVPEDIQKHIMELSSFICSRIKSIDEAQQKVA